MQGAFLHPFSRPLEDRFITLVRGRGARVWDDRGNEYIDGLASLWYCHVGHGREEIAEAMAEQARTLGGFHAFYPFTNEPAERLGDRIAALSGIDGARVFLTDSGSEAVDTAVKLVRLACRERGDRDRTLIVTREDAYHGVTYGGTSAQGLPLNREGWGELVPGFVHLPRCGLDAARALFAERGREIAAVLTEPVQAAGGVHPPEPGYLEGLRALCDEHGALLVFDEVVCGFGRIGAWFGYQHYGVRPDAVIFAKGVTSGYQPLGGVVLGPEIMKALTVDPQRILRHGFTYSGHPTACAAALANLDLIETGGLLARAKAIGDRLGAGLSALESHPKVRAVRGLGAIWGVELVEELDVLDVRDRMLGRGVIARPLPHNVLAYCPALVIADDEIDRLVSALADSLDG